MRSASPLLMEACALRLAFSLVAMMVGCGESFEPQPIVNGDVVEIPSPAAPGSVVPNLSAGPDGRVYLSWIEPDGRGHALLFAVLGEEGWSEARRITRGDDWYVNWTDVPSVVALPGGRLAAHYLQKSRGASERYHYEIKIVQSLDGGVTWSAPIVPHRDGVQTEHGYVSLFPAAGDSLGVVWLDGRKLHPGHGHTEETTLHYTAVAADGSLGQEVAIDHRVCDCCSTSVALAASGPVVAYRDRGPTEVRDIYVVRLIAGRWTGGRPVHRDNWKIAACPVNGPAVAALGKRVAVAWFTAQEQSSWRARNGAGWVYLSFSDDSGAQFGRPIQIAAGRPAGRVDVELLENNGALVSWVERLEPGVTEVRIRYVAPDGSVAPSFPVSTAPNPGVSGFPHMAVAGDRLIVAWTQPGELSQVRAARAALRSGR